MVRRISQRYYGPKEHRIDLSDARRRHWLNVQVAKCVGCDKLTRHACLNDGAGEFDGRDIGEEANREADAARSRLTRRVAGLRAVGVQVEWTEHPLLCEKSEDSWPAGLELRQNGRLRTVVFTLWDGAAPVELLKALEHVERLVDDRSTLEKAVASLAGGVVLR